MLDRSLLVRTAVLAASGAMLMAATAPVAGGGNDGPKSAGPESATTNSQPEKKYCVEFMITGSMLPHRECRTRADWEARGATFKTKTGHSGQNVE